MDGFIFKVKVVLEVGPSQVRKIHLPQILDEESGDVSFEKLTELLSKTEFVTHSDMTRQYRVSHLMYQDIDDDCVNLTSTEELLFAMAEYETIGVLRLTAEIRKVPETMVTMSQLETLLSDRLGRLENRLLTVGTPATASFERIIAKLEGLHERLDRLEKSIVTQEAAIVVSSSGLNNHYNYNTNQNVPMTIRGSISPTANTLDPFRRNQQLEASSFSSPSLLGQRIDKTTTTPLRETTNHNDPREISKVNSTSRDDHETPTGPSTGGLQGILHNNSFGRVKKGVDNNHASDPLANEKRSFFGGLAEEAAATTTVALNSTEQIHKDVQDLLSSDPKVVSEAIARLRVAARDSSNEAEIRRAGGISKIVVAMSRTLMEVECQTNACGCFGNLAFNDENRRAIQAEGGIPLIVTAMKTHPSYSDLQKNGCGALQNLSYNNTNRVKIEEAGGIITVVYAMKAFSRDLDLLRNACGALQNLAGNNDIRIAIREAGGIHEIVTLMSRNPDEMALLANACGALWNLAANEENRKHIMNEGAIPHIIAAMKRHPEKRLQESACGALAKLSHEQDIRMGIRSEGGVYQIVEAMKQYPNHAGLQKNGINVLKRLSSTGNNLKLIEEAGGKLAVEEALNRYANNKDVQVLGKTFLQQYNSS